MIELPGTAKGGELVQTLMQLESRRQYLISMEGKGVTEILKATRKSKTNRQVRTHFGLLIKTTIAKTNKTGIDTSDFLKLIVRDDLPSGVGLNENFLNQLFYVVCPTYDKDGQRVTLSQMTSAEASSWLKRCRNLLASRGIFIPEPDENWKENQSSAT